MTPVTSQKSSILKKSLQYISGATFNKILMVLLLPLFTRKLNPADYALYGNITIFIGFFTLFYFLGLPQALYPFFYKDKSAAYKGSLIKTIYSVLFIVGLIFSILVIASRSVLSLYILKDQIWSNLFVYAAFIIYFDVFYSITLTLLNVMEKSFIYAILGFIKNLVFLLLLLVAYFIDRFTIELIIQFMLISSIISASIAVIILLTKIFPSISHGVKAKFSIPILKEVLRFSLPMLPGTVAFLALRISDRYMLTWLSPGGLYDVGIYSVAYRIGTAISFATSLLSIIYYPYAMRISKEDFAEHNYRKVHSIYILLGGFLAFSLILFLKEIFAIFIDPTYLESMKYVVFGIVSVFLLGAFHIVNIPYYNARKSTRIAFIAITGALLNIFLNYLFIPQYGIWAAGISSVIAYFYIYLFTLIGANSMSLVKFNVIPLLFVLVALFLTNFINITFLDFNKLIYKIVILALVISIMYLSGFLKSLKKFYQDRR